jgi:MarR family transcriptional regulator, organic hydroperoxide resistance regulator
MSTTPATAAKRGPDEDNTRHRDATTLYGAAFKGAMGAVRRLRGRDTHRSGELSYAQFGLLFGLADRGELSASELAGVADLAPGTATQMLDGLEAHGLITRTRSELDRRCVLVSLTPGGSELIDARRCQYQQRWDEALAGFTTKELKTAAAVLDRTHAMFDELARAAEQSGA